MFFLPPPLLLHPTLLKARRLRAVLASERRRLDRKEDCRGEEHDSNSLAFAGCIVCQSFGRVVQQLKLADPRKYTEDLSREELDVGVFLSVVSSMSIVSPSCAAGGRAALMS